MTSRHEINQPVIAEFRANGGKVGGRLLIIASNGGTPNNPDWYYNLIANPEAAVELGTERFAARATIPDGGEQEDLWQRVFKHMPFFADHQLKAGRRLPVVVLERAG